ncbi:MAG: ABC transporter permease [Chloroflexi bacterium]|nr:ABC transporter permease [Chloroflexota bacterium]
MAATDRTTSARSGEIADPTLPPRPSGRAIWLHDLWSDKVSLLAAAALVLFLLAAALIPPLQGEEANLPNLRYRNKPPLAALDPSGTRTWLGTDQLGRHLLARLAEAGRLSMTVGAATVVLSGVLGTWLGVLAGYRGGRTDDLIMRVCDIQMAFPTLLLAMFILYALGPGFLNLILVLAITRWPLFARTSRGMALSLRNQLFVEAAQAIGASEVRIVARHILPSVMPTLLVLGTLEVGRAVLSEASLSFIGLGVQPPESSWGLMLAQGREYISTAWWLTVFPGLAIVLLTLSANLLAQWFQRITDPFQRTLVLKTAAGPESKSGR